jgi:hypothetical protein
LDWTPPQELMGALPRQKRLTKRGVFAFVLALVMMAGAILAFVGFRMAQSESNEFNRKMRAQGRAATAKILRLWRTEGKGATDMVTYAFSAGGARVQGDCEVPLHFWAGLHKGADLPVRYLPSDPAVNHPAAWEEDTVPMFVAVGLPALPAAIGLFLLIMVVRRGQIAAYGLPAPGTVAMCESLKTGWAVKYRFRTKEGAAIGGRDQSDQPYRTGAAVCVLYLPRNPARNSLYPLTWYRLTQ